MMHMCDVLACESVGISRINHSLSGVWAVELGIVFIKSWNFKDKCAKKKRRENIFHINFNSLNYENNVHVCFWYVLRCMCYMCFL